MDVSGVRLQGLFLMAIEAIVSTCLPEITKFYAMTWDKLETRRKSRISYSSLDVSS